MKKEELQNKLSYFIESEKEDEKSKKTIELYKRVATNFCDSLGSDDMTKSDVIKFKQTLIESYKPATIQTYITALNKFIKFAELTEMDDDFDFRKMKKYYSKNTVKNIKVQDIDSVDTILSPADFKRMRRMAKQIGDMRSYYLISVYGLTGIRASEIKFFTVENLERSKDFVQISNKGKIRKVPIPSDLRRELIKYARSIGIESGEIFPIDYQTIYKSIKRIASKCRGINLKSVHPHAFRHLFAYYFLNGNETNLAELADILGHSSIETTRIYLRSTVKMKKKKMEDLKY